MIKAWLAKYLSELLGIVILALLVAFAVQTYRVQVGKAAVANANLDKVKLQGELDKAQRDYAQSKSNQSTLSESLATCSAQLDAFQAKETAVDEASTQAALAIVATKPAPGTVKTGNAKEMNSWLRSLFPAPSSSR